MTANSYSIFSIEKMPDREEEYFFISLLDDGGSLTVTLKGSKSNALLIITFRFSFSYTKSNESYRLATNLVLPDGRYIILKTDRSDFLDWFHKESQNLYAAEKISHFIIVTGDDIIDVLSSEGPKIEYQA